MNMHLCIALSHGTRAVSFIRLACAASALGLFALCAVPQNFGNKGIVVIWKMDAEKSSFPGPNAPASVVMKIEKRSADAFRETFEMVMKDGQKRQMDLIRTYDGKWRPVEGQTGLAEACDALDTHTHRCTQKRNETVVLEVLSRMSQDGKTTFAQRTIFAKDGKPISGVVVYEKQSASGS